jgi:hypothetical protein
VTPPIIKKEKIEKMQISKKIYTTLIIAILTLSTIAAVLPVALAVPINTPTLSTPSGNVGDMITVSGDGATPFGPVNVYWDDLGTEIDSGFADDTGAYSFPWPFAGVTIPEDVAGPHDIIVMDTLSSTIASETFTIIPEIVASEDVGLPGDVIDVTGTGFSSGFMGFGAAYGLYLGTIATMPADPVIVSTGTPATGTLSESAIVINTVAMSVDVTISGTVLGASETGTTTVLVTDNGEGDLAGTVADVPVATGEVDVTISGSINYKTGVFTLLATGVDSAGADPVTAISVTVDNPVVAGYDFAEYNVTPSAAVTTGSGSIDASFTIPSIPVVAYGAYDIYAVDVMGNSATFVTLVVDYFVTVTPDSGPTGITVTIAGRIPANTPYQLTLDGNLIGGATSGADTTFSETEVMSEFLALGFHDIKVIWDTVNERVTQFEVTPKPQVAFAPTSAVAGAVITISSVTGFPFSAGAKITLYLGTTVVNSTDLDDRFGPTLPSFMGPAAGSFSDLEFTVPTITPGFYNLRVEDEYGASTVMYTFQVLPTPVTTIGLNSDSYYLGDTLSFTVVSTDDLLGSMVDVTIADPMGSVWWDNTWGTMAGPGGIEFVPFEWQLFGVDEHATFPADAPTTGSWNWTIMYTPASTGLATKVSGLFTVSAMPTTAGIETKLDELETTLIDAINEIKGEITDITGDVATIKTDVGQVETLVSNLDISQLSGDLATIKSNQATLDAILGQLVMDVADLEATVTAIEGDVATVDTTLGTLQGTVTAIEGNTATIETDVGTLQADVTDVKGSVDSTPAWIAVVLSLVAAIAAIFAVITIRQKIAG